MFIFLWFISVYGRLTNLWVLSNRLVSAFDSLWQPTKFTRALSKHVVIRLKRDSQSMSQIFKINHFNHAPTFGFCGSSSKQSPRPSWRNSVTAFFEQTLQGCPTSIRAIVELIIWDLGWREGKLSWHTRLSSCIMSRTCPTYPKNTKKWSWYSNTILTTVKSKNHKHLY